MTRFVGNPASILKATRPVIAVIESGATGRRALCAQFRRRWFPALFHPREVREALRTEVISIEVLLKEGANSLPFPRWPCIKKPFRQNARRKNKAARTGPVLNT